VSIAANCLIQGLQTFGVNDEDAKFSLAFFYVSISLHYLKCHLNYEVLSIGNGKNSRAAVPPWQPSTPC
jgi:hypothetical protein